MATIKITRGVNASGYKWLNPKEHLIPLLIPTALA